jgi:hypothetical protein
MEMIVNSPGMILERAGRWTTLAVFLCAGLGVGGCGAVYPELSTPVREPPPGFAFEPQPPSDLVFIAFSKATIPEKTRDGRAWDSVGGSLPDPFAKLIVDDKSLITTPVQANTRQPTWPSQKRGNYRIASSSKLRVELWDSNPINNHPICTEEVHDFSEEVAAGGRIQVNCDSGAFVELIAEPAHGKIGLGLYYEIRTDDVAVVRVIRESPASRAGIAGGDQIVRIMGETVKGMDAGRVRSLINSNGATGLKLALRTGNKPEHEVMLKDGPVYSLLGED